MTLSDYAELVRWTGQAIRHDKPGALSPELCSMLRKVGLNDARWLETFQRFPGERAAVLGERRLIDAETERRGVAHLCGSGWAKRAYLAA